MKSRIIISLITVMCALIVCVVTPSTAEEGSSESTTPKYFGSITLSPGSSYVKVDNVSEEINVIPFYYNDSIYVAIDDFMKYFDAELTMYGNDFCITQGAIKIYANVDSNILRVHYELNPFLDTNIYMNNKCCVMDGHVCMSVRVLAEGLFAGSVFWNEQNNTAAVTRDYRSKRLLFSTESDLEIPVSIPYKEVKRITNTIWTMQFETDIPDLIVKMYEDYLANQVPGVRAVDPDIVITTT